MAIVLDAATRARRLDAADVSSSDAVVNAALETTGAIATDIATVDELEEINIPGYLATAVATLELSGASLGNATTSLTLDVTGGTTFDDTGAMVMMAFVKLDEVFAGTGITAATVAVGTKSWNGAAADVDSLVDETDIFTGATLGILTPNSGTLMSSGFAVVTPIDGFTATLTTVGANIQDLDTGRFRVFICQLQMPLAV